MIFPFLKRTQQTRRTQTYPRSLLQQVAFAFITILLIFFFWKNYEMQTQNLFTEKTVIPAQTQGITQTQVAGITQTEVAGFTQTQENALAQTQGKNQVHVQTHSQASTQEVAQKIPLKKGTESTQQAELSAAKSNSTERELSAAKSNSTERELSAVKSNCTERELSAVKSNCTELGLLSKSLETKSLFPSKSDVFDHTNSFSPAALQALKSYGANFQKQYAFPLLIAIYHGELPLRKLIQYRQEACIIAYSPLLQQCYIAFCPDLERHIGAKAIERYERRMLDVTIKEWPVRLESVLNEISLILNLALKKEKKVFQ